MQTCTNCGNELVPDDRFCRKCGLALPGGAPPVPAGPPAGAGVEDNLRQRAEKIVEERYELLMHFGIYVVINVILVGVWLLTGAGYPWFLWVVLAWGAGIIIHLISFWMSSRAGIRKDLLIEKEIKRLKDNQGETDK